MGQSRHLARILVCLLGVPLAACAAQVDQAARTPTLTVGAKGDAPAATTSASPAGTPLPTSSSTASTPASSSSSATATLTPTPATTASQASAATLTPASTSTPTPLPTPTTSVTTKQVPTGSAAAIAPSITKVSPPEVPATGGTSIIITGRGFDAVTAVRIGGVGARITSATSSSIVVVAPARAAGLAPVEVTTPVGTASGRSIWLYGPPVISKVDQPFGPIRGGVVVNIIGPWVHEATSVTFGSRPSTIVTAGLYAGTDLPRSEGLGIVVVRSPQVASPATVPVVVTTPMGVARLDNAYDYYGQPTITSVTPNSGPAAGGNDVVIRGRWVDYARVDRPPIIGGSGTQIIGRAKDQLTVRIPVDPARKPGVVNVTVLLDYAVAEAAGAYTFRGTIAIPSTLSPTPVALPTMTTITPDNGIYAGGDPVTITGTGLAGATQVRFGANAAQITGRTTTSVTVISPASTILGPVTVTVVTPQGAATKSGGFTYWSPNR